jgi:hypothetical protein
LTLSSVNSYESGVLGVNKEIPLRTEKSAINIKEARYRGPTIVLAPDARASALGLCLSTAPTAQQSVGSSGADCRTQLLSDLKDWDRSDRLNSTSWSGEGYSSVSLCYAGQGEKANRLIGQLEQGKKVSREDVDEASDAEAIKWGGFS